MNEIDNAQSAAGMKLIMLGQVDDGEECLSPPRYPPPHSSASWVQRGYSTLGWGGIVCLRSILTAYMAGTGNREWATLRSGLE